MSTNDFQYIYNITQCHFSMFLNTVRCFRIKYSSLPCWVVRTTVNTNPTLKFQARHVTKNVGAANNVCLKSCGVRKEKRIQCSFGFLFCCDFVFVGQTNAKKMGSGGFKATFWLHGNGRKRREMKGFLSFG